MIYKNTFVKFLILVLTPTFLFAQQAAIKHPQPETPLAQRWEWALVEARQSIPNSDYWIGFRLERLMNERSFIWSSDGTFISSNGSIQIEGISLKEMVYGKTAEADQLLSEEEQIRREAQQALDEIKGIKKPEKKVLKEIAVLFQYPANSAKANEVKRIIIQSMEFSAELQKKPLFWLGGGAPEETISHLQNLYQEVSSIQLKEEIITAAGMCRQPALVIPFLESILQSETPVELRQEAVGWLGEQHDPKALEILIRTAGNDRSHDVRQEAVEAIGAIETEGAVEALIAIAQNDRDSDIRREAVESLGYQNTPQAISVLEKFVFEDRSAEVQHEALEALAEISGQNTAEKMIHIYQNHPDEDIRHSAMEYLAEIAADKAVAALDNTIDNEEDLNIKLEALETLADLPDNAGISRLIEIGQTHPDRRVRKTAIELLGDSDDPRAHAALIEIVEKQSVTSP